MKDIIRSRLLLSARKLISESKLTVIRLPMEIMKAYVTRSVEYVLLDYLLRRM